jgi:hypothetical protein
MANALTQLRSLPDPEITVDEAIASCEGLCTEHPQMGQVAHRIKQLREERDLYHKVAGKSMSDAAWERSDMKKWADKQRVNPDND